MGTFFETQCIDNVAVNDVLPLKAARRRTIAKVKCFGAPGQKRPNFNGFIYIRYAEPPYSARISSIYLLPFGKVWLGSVCYLRVQRLATKHNEENRGPIFIRLWTKVHEILGQCRDPS